MVLREVSLCLALMALIVFTLSRLPSSVAP